MSTKKSAPYQPGISVVIRTFNEKEAAKDLFLVLKSQRYAGDVQIVVVDNDSGDGTPELARDHGFEIVTIPRGEFSYPRSMNLGVERSRHEIVILTVGHALPLDNHWFSSAARHFADESVAGVYSPVLPHKGHSVAEALLYYPGYIRSRLRSPYLVGKVASGVFGATNVALRRSLWEVHPFDERYGLGGEDAEWAQWALSAGNKIVCDTDFCVRHSHHLGFAGVIKQVKYWNKLRNHTAFSHGALSFRNDIDLSKERTDVNHKVH